MDRSLVHLVPRSRSWPLKLSTIEAPPEDLWCSGRLDVLAREPKVALIGTRAPTMYGEAQTRRFARTLAEHGVVVVSGLARGIDSVAHETTLESNGATIAVLGCGVDRPWPAGPLATRVAREGLLLSEYAPGTPPRRHHFPERNRLISGLCDAVIVIEAAHASGSLITARWAADQGRAVFAVPGRIDHPMARGCHRLIREGASLVEDPEEVLEELGFTRSGPPETPFELGTRRGRSSSAPRASAGSRESNREGEREGSPGAEHEVEGENEFGPEFGPELENGLETGRDAVAGRHGLDSRLLEALRGETLTPDDLAERTGQPVTEVLTALVELELAGRIVRGAGSLYRR